MLKNGRVAICFFGEGALGQGLLYEVMNMAALWKLPVIYVCENNLYTEYTYFSEVMAGDLKNRPQAFGIPVVEVDGQDVGAVYAAIQTLVKRARDGEGPGFLLCHTYRYFGHHVGDINRAYYRSKDEEDEWKARRDPIKRMADWLSADLKIEPSILEDIQKQARQEIVDGVAFAHKTPYPDLGEVTTNVYA
jgi:TPP-dependent pyruvate/acetoin dehydrogenase alpha subunit